MDFNSIYPVLEKEVIHWLKVLVAALPNLLIALVVFFIFFLLGKYSQKGARKLLNKVTDYNDSVTLLAAKSVRFSVISIGVFASLGILNLDRTVASLLAGAGVFGLVIGLAFKETFTNYLSGFMIAVRQPYIVGDIIETNDYLAIVKSLNLRTTVLDNFKGQLLIIPNGEIFAKPIINYSKTGRRRIDININIDYTTELIFVKIEGLKVLQQLTFRIQSEEPQFFFTNFSENAIQCELRFWVEYPSETLNFADARSMAMQAIREKFEQLGITIPINQRTMIVKSE